MGISSRQWLLAIAAAVVAHLLLLAGLWLGDTANDRPAETPRGVARLTSMNLLWSSWPVPRARRAHGAFEPQPGYIFFIDENIA